MTAKTRLFVVGEIPFDVVQTVIDELFAANHDIFFRRYFDGFLGHRLPKILPGEFPLKRNKFQT